MLYLEVSRNIPFCSIWNVNGMFLDVKLLLYPLFGYHGNSYSYNLYRKWTHVEKHNFRILAFKTELRYYYWIRKYE